MLMPDGARGSGTRSASVRSMRRRLGHARGSAAGRRRPASPARRCRARRAPAPGRRRRRPGRPSWPTARIRTPASRRASAWSGIVRAARSGVGAAASRTRATKPVHASSRPGMMPPHGPRPRPLAAGCELPAPTPARRSSTPRLQPPLDVAPAHPRPVQRRRPHGLGALPEPDPGHQRPDRLVAPARRPALPGRVPRRPDRLRQLHGQRRRPLVPAPLRRRRWRARSPTSAPNTASTNRSGSTRAASGSSPATT